jgi:hypothetical protein
MPGWGPGAYFTCRAHRMEALGPHIIMSIYWDAYAILPNAVMKYSSGHFCVTATAWFSYSRPPCEEQRSLESSHEF